MRRGQSLGAGWSGGIVRVRAKGGPIRPWHRERRQFHLELRLPVSQQLAASRDACKKAAVYSGGLVLICHHGGMHEPVVTP